MIGPIVCAVRIKADVKLDLTSRNLRRRSFTWEKTTMSVKPRFIISDLHLGEGGKARLKISQRRGGQQLVKFGRGGPLGRAHLVGNAIALISPNFVRSQPDPPQNI